MFETYFLLFLGSGHYLWGGRLVNGRKRSFTLINRGGGGVNSKKEDSENAISNNLETRNFPVPTMVAPCGSQAH